jgi:hypothetical protein
MTPIFEDVLRALLVGTDVAGTRVFLARAPQVPADQQRTPYLVFFSVGPTPRHAMGGPVSVQDVEYQVSIFEPSQSKALAIAATLKQKLDGVAGDYAGVRFGGIFYRSQSSDYESHANIHHVFMTFRILFEFLPEFENFTIHPRKPNATERRITQ